MAHRLTLFLVAVLALVSCRSTTSPEARREPVELTPAASSSPAAPSAAAPAPAAPSARALPGPCSLLEPRDRTERDWRRETTRYFDAEFVGLLLRIDRPGTELAAVKKGFDHLRDGTFVFEPCPNAILAFTRVRTTPQCPEEMPSYVPKNVGPITRLHCFDRSDFTAEFARDCIDDVISKEKCRKLFEPRVHQDHCGSGSHAENLIFNELAIHLGLAPPGSRICLD